MLLSVGYIAQRTLRPGISVRDKRFDFTSGIPDDFTFTRSGNTATYRDDTGDWQQALANTPRIDHDENGNVLGQRFEQARTNKSNHSNFEPTNIGDISVVVGDGAADVVIDTVKLQSATIDGATFEGLSNNRVIRLTGGTSGTGYKLSLNTGNLNPHSFRVVARTNGIGGYQGNIKVGAGLGQKNWDVSGEYTEIVSENLTPDTTSRFLYAFVTAGNTVLLCATQFEEGKTISSPIITSGTTGATRGSEVMRCADLSTKDWFDYEQGCMIADGAFDNNIGTDNQYMFNAGTNGSITNALGMFSINGIGQARGRDSLDGAFQQNLDLQKPVANKRFPMGISWQSGSSLAVAGSMTHYNDTYSDVRTSIDDLYVGYRGIGSDYFSGWISSLTVFTTPQSLNQMASIMFPGTRSYRAISNAGQSNAEGHHRSQETQDNGGEIAALAQMDGVWTATENWYLDNGISGSGLVQANDASTPWLISLNGADGSSLTQWKNTVGAFGKANVRAIRWDQGASDRGDTEQEIYDHTKEVFDRMRTFLGFDCPVFIAPISARADLAADQYNKVKRAHEGLAEDFSWIHLTPPQNNVAFGSDNIHLSNESYADMANIQARKILHELGESISGAVDAPEILTATRSGTIITAPVTFPTGITAIVPTADIAGFRFFDDGTEIAITAATYASGNITIELDSAPTGAEELYFGFGSMTSEIADVADFASGNDANALGIQNTKIVIT